MMKLTAFITLARESFRHLHKRFATNVDGEPCCVCKRLQAQHFFNEQYILHYLSRKPLNFLVNQVRVGVVNLYTLMDIFKEKPEHLCTDGSLCNVNDLPIGQYIMAVF